MLTKGTLYADTSRAVADAQAILHHAQRAYQRSETLLKRQVKERMSLNARTQQSLSNSSYVASELRSPAKEAVTTTVRSLEDEIVQLSTAAQTLEASVRRSAATKAKRQEQITSWQRTVDAYRAQTNELRTQLESTTGDLAEQLHAVEKQLQALDREQNVLEEQNEYYRIQASLRRQYQQQQKQVALGASPSGVADRGTSDVPSPSQPVTASSSSSPCLSSPAADRETKAHKGSVVIGAAVEGCSDDTTIRVLQTNGYTFIADTITNGTDR